MRRGWNRRGRKEKLAELYMWGDLIYAFSFFFFLSLSALVSFLFLSFR